MKENKTDNFKQLIDLLSSPEPEPVEENEEENADLTQGNNMSLVVEERERLRNQLMEADIKDRNQDRDQRRNFASKIFIFMCFYMAVALLIVACCGFGWMYLSDTVLITLLTTTLADVIGIFSFVTKYLYHNK